MTMAGSLRSGSKTCWSPKANAVRTAPVALLRRHFSTLSGRPVSAGGLVFQHLVGALRGRSSYMAAPKLVDVLVDLLVLEVTVLVGTLVQRVGLRRLTGPSSLLRGALTGTERMPIGPGPAHVSLLGTFFGVNERHLFRVALRGPS